MLYIKNDPNQQVVMKILLDYLFMRNQMQHCIQFKQLFKIL